MGRCESRAPRRRALPEGGGGVRARARTFFWSCSRPYSSASAVGGQPGTYMSMGTCAARARARKEGGHEKTVARRRARLPTRGKHARGPIDCTHDAVHAADHRVRVVVVAAAVGARAHGHDPPPATRARQGARRANASVEEKTGAGNSGGTQALARPRTGRASGRKPCAEPAPSCSSACPPRSSRRTAGGWEE